MEPPPPALTSQPPSLSLSKTFSLCLPSPILSLSLCVCLSCSLCCLPWSVCASAQSGCAQRFFPRCRAGQVYSQLSPTHLWSRMVFHIAKGMMALFRGLPSYVTREVSKVAPLSLTLPLSLPFLSSLPRKQQRERASERAREREREKERERCVFI
jgi:hypothetical protein